ncbi:glucose-1-phosphate thymidylyltransferase [[Eubacterium] cellulosolvens]
MKGVILHGGAGTRLRPLTHTGPKQLIPIANKPMSLYAVEALRDAGITEIAIVLGSLAPERVQEYYADGARFGVSITYVHQGEPKGIAHAVKLTEYFVGDEPFVVFLADNLLKGGIREMVDEFENSRAAAEIALCHVPNPQSFGIADMKDGRIVRLVEKPKDAPSDLALVGIYLFRKPVFHAIRRLQPSWRNELEITDAIQTLLDDGLEVRHRLVKGWWKDTGRPEDILEANQLVLSELSSYNRGALDQDVKISGTVCIDEGVVVHARTSLRGPLIIGKNCEIGPDAYVGPYTSIGNNTLIRGAEVENTIIMEECRIDCKKRIVDSLIGRNTQITDSANSLPRGSRFIIGENTFICL